MKLFLLLSVFTLMVTRVQAGDTIIVTASRLGMPLEQQGTGITVISEEELRRKQGSTVTEILRDVPGLDITTSGGLGRASSVFIRGAKSEHTLVLIDGVAANDPMSPSRAFDFGNLSAGNIERIEIIRGAQSVVHGSDAIGGVINIITKKGKGVPTPSVRAEYGSYGTYTAGADVAGSSEATNYSFSADTQGTQGFSVADQALGNSEKDKARLVHFSGRAGTRVSPTLLLDATARFESGAFDTDRSGGPGGDDPNYTCTAKMLTGRLSAKSDASASWEPSFGLSYTRTLRTADNDPDPASTSILHTRFDGQRIKPEAQARFPINEVSSVATGLEHVIETGSSTEDYGAGITSLSGLSSSITGAWIEHQYQSVLFFSSEGLRLDRHDRFGSVVTYRISPSLDFGSARIKASLGSGFKAPTLYQLYSQFGDLALLPERTLSYDFGIESRAVEAGFILSLTYFHASFDQLIDYDFASNKYKNISRASTRGLELEAKIRATEELRFAGTYTYTLARNEVSGQALIRRPRHKTEIASRLRYSDAGEASASLRLIGTRADADALTGSALVMPSYALVGLSLEHRALKDLQLTARVDNLLDRKYEEINGFGTPGRSFFAGFRKTF